MERLKKLQEIKSLLRQERLKEKLGKQNFHYDMEEVFEPVTENQKQSQNQTKLESEKQIQALRDSTQTTTQAIGNQIRAIQHSSDISNKSLQKLNKNVNSNQVDSSIVKTVSNLLNDKNKNQFSLEPVESNPNSFTHNPNNPQEVITKGSTLTSLSNHNTYSLIDPDLSYFETKTQIDKKMQNVKLVYIFLFDMKYDLNCGDKKLSRYNINEKLFQPQLGS